MQNPWSKLARLADWSALGSQEGLPSEYKEKRNREKTYQPLVSVQSEHGQKHTCSTHTYMQKIKGFSTKVLKCTEES